MALGFSLQHVRERVRAFISSSATPPQTPSSSSSAHHHNRAAPHPRVFKEEEEEEEERPRRRDLWTRLCRQAVWWRAKSQHSTSSPAQQPRRRRRSTTSTRRRRRRRRTSHNTTTTATRHTVAGSLSFHKTHRRDTEMSLPNNFPIRLPRPAAHPSSQTRIPVDIMSESMSQNHTLFSSDDDDDEVEDDDEFDHDDSVTCSMHSSLLDVVLGSWRPARQGRLSRRALRKHDLAMCGLSNTPPQRRHPQPQQIQSGGTSFLPTIPSKPLTAHTLLSSRKLSQERDDDDLRSVSRRARLLFQTVFSSDGCEFSQDDVDVGVSTAGREDVHDDDDDDDDDDDGYDQPVAFAMDFARLRRPTM